MTKLSQLRIAQETIKLCDAIEAEHERHRRALDKLFKKAERLEALTANKAQSKSAR